MAIVNRSKRQLKLIDSKTASLGPGSYDVNYSLATPSPQVPKILPPHKAKPQVESSNPIFQPIADKENIVMINQEEQLYVTEVKKQGLMHRSRTKRMEFTTGSTAPGVGSYNIQKNILKPSIKYEGPKLQKSHILEEIFKSPHYQTSSISDFENQTTVKQKPKLPHKLASTYLSSATQPGYTLSKDQRFKENQHVLSQNPGPGAYQLAAQPKEKKKSAKTYTEFLDNHMSKITHDTTKYSEDCESEDSVEYIKEAVPGPGSYDLQSSTHSKAPFSKSIQRFGSTAQRFVPQKVYWKGKQFDHEMRAKQHTSKRKDLAFGRSKSSNLLKRIDKSSELGPGFYNDPRTTVNKINDFMEKGYVGNFGSSAIRFKPFRPQYQNRTDFYLSPYTQQGEEEDSNTCVFKSKTTQGQSYYIRKDYTTENYYSQDFNTIKRRLREERIRETEQVVMQPPFGNGMVRFNYKVKQFQPVEEGEDEPENYEIPYKKQETAHGFTFFKSNPENKPSLLPGPGTYQYSDNWNSKTHNVLFLT